MNTLLDLRPPERDETPLSREEVLRGLRDGSIPNGPLARSYGFAAVVVVERRVVEYFDFSDGPLPATIARGFA